MLNINYFYSVLIYEKTLCQIILDSALFNISIVSVLYGMEFEVESWSLK